MRNYLFNISEEEKQNILDKHKTLYDGYAVKQISSNAPQPLYVQDLANDKGGITINNKGDVSTYNNKIYMKESKNMCSECGLYEDVCECGKGGMYETECSECGGMMREGECSECGYKQVKGIGDKFDYVDEMEEGEKDQDIALALGAEGDENMALAMDEKDPLDEVLDEIQDEEQTMGIKESVSESLNWFKRFKNYN